MKRNLLSFHRDDGSRARVASIGEYIAIYARRDLREWVARP